MRGEWAYCMQYWEPRELETAAPRVAAGQWRRVCKQVASAAEEKGHVLVYPALLVRREEDGAQLKHSVWGLSVPRVSR